MIDNIRALGLVSLFQKVFIFEQIMDGLITIKFGICPNSNTVLIGSYKKNTNKFGFGHI